MSNILSLANVLNISVAAPQTGLTQYNTSNVALFSRESYTSSFGTAGFKIYLNAAQVGVDFGTGSNTYAMALALFAQSPNILANGGYLVIIPFLTNAQNQQVTVSYPATPVSGTYELSYNGNSTVPMSYNVSAATLQSDLRSVTGLSSATASGSYTTSFAINTLSSSTYPITVSSNSMVDSKGNAVTPVVTLVVPGSTAETVDQAILRTMGTVAYFGVMSAEVPSQIVMLAAAALIQTLNMIMLVVSYTASDVNNGGMLDLLRSGGFTQTRGLFYDDALGDALTFMAAYAGLGFSTNFNGSLTTQTMNLKTLNTIQPDPNITQTILTAAVAAGADVYVNLGGVAKVLSNGANDFFDNQYNLQWFAGALLVAYFNALATTNTKVPQTENGMSIIKAALRQVCQLAVANGFLAPGEWTNPVTFGNQASLLLNVAQRGYYIYSSPISQQLPAVRTTRAAPLIQLAAKYAGAIQSGSVVVYVNS